MHTIDRITVRAPLARVFAAAAGVERWPSFLPHYRWVRFHERRGSGGVVEMAAWRPFGPLRWPTWWTSEMTVDAAAHEIRYRHIGGITRGMDVVWRLRPANGAVAIELQHDWTGPRLPLIGRAAAAFLIGPVFVHGIASRTLAGLKRELEREP